jgi:hypothetical protein
VFNKFYSIIRDRREVFTLKDAAERRGRIQALNFWGFVWFLVLKHDRHH